MGRSTTALTRKPACWNFFFQASGLQSRSSVRQDGLVPCGGQTINLRGLSIFRVVATVVRLRLILTEPDSGPREASVHCEPRTADCLIPRLSQTLLNRFSDRLTDHLPRVFRLKQFPPCLSQFTSKLSVLKQPHATLGKNIGLLCQQNIAIRTDLKTIGPLTG